MRRAFISICAALGLVLSLSTPASATVTEREKLDYGNGCGSGNSATQVSWIDLDDKNTGTNTDDKIDYNAKGPAAYGDLRMTLFGDNHQIYDIAVEIRKLNAAGTAYVVHHAEGRSYSNGADNYEYFEFSSVSTIDRDRQPYLWVKVTWDDGACVTKTAYFDNWVP